MSKKRKLTYAMIETAIDKGIRDIKENSSRGTRNLLDLGNHFATGRFQKVFFRIAMQMLDNESSPYYELANHIVQHVKPQLIKHFGINLGYNSWTYGAGKIREYEKKHGYNIPWTIVFDFLDDSESKLSDTDISKILHSGEAMGIYCGMFFASRSEEQLIALLIMLKAHKDSSYIVFLQPELITDKIADIIINACNIVIVLAMDTEENSINCKKASDILLDKQCLYGAYCMYNDDNVEYITSDKYLRQVEALNCSFAFLIRQRLNEPHNKEHFSQFMQTAKSASKYKFFMFDFYEDLAYVDRIISVEDCFIAIKGDGTIAVSSRYILAEGLNILTHSLENILQKTMPKTQYV